MSLTIPKVCPECSMRYDAEAVVCENDGTPLVEDPEALVGTTLDGIYRVERLIGQGGFGVVYLARHALLRDLVAIKILPRHLSSNPDRVERFTPTAEGRLLYEYTVDAPTVFTRPFTVAVPLRASRERIFEYACHEGNYAMRGMLRGARTLEAEESAAKRAETSAAPAP